ncbi:MAG: E3 binding domain-containing protein, partial [Chloroflexi bacterium]|nr:E3 binding domain-containing protein [Chloroflexota bacterium]
PAPPPEAAAAPASEAAPAEPEREAAGAPARTATPPPGDQPVFAAPSVRKFAREVGVDLASVTGSGPGGRISEGDVKLAARERAAQPCRLDGDSG